MKRKMLFALPVFILLASLFLDGYAHAKHAPPWARTFAPIVSTDWLKENLYRKKLVILDIRSDVDYGAGHIPGAINEPLVDIFNTRWVVSDPGGLWLELPETEALFETIGNLGITSKSLVVIVTAPADPPVQEYGLANATRVALTLIYARIKNVAILDGGYPKWMEDYPGPEDNTVEPTYPVLGNYSGKVKDAMFVSTEYVEGQIGKAVIIDARDAIVYFGNEVEPWANSVPDDLGHIESARSLPAPWIWNWNGDEIYTYKEKKALSKMASRAICGSCGYKGHGSQEIIVYCGVGGYASSWWFVLTQVLGYKNVKIYDGSAQEWAGNEFYDNEMVPDRCD
jgi:thiosulfate/3-mercaptopyruvate sulfurtransferase